MAKFIVNLKKPKNETMSPIDTVYASDNYTARDYVFDCERYADKEWTEMLRGGEVCLTQVNET